MRNLGLGRPTGASCVGPGVHVAAESSGRTSSWLRTHFFAASGVVHDLVLSAGVLS